MVQLRDLRLLQKFGDSLKTDDKPAFHDLLERLASCPDYFFESPVRQMSLIFTILMLHQKMLREIVSRL